MSCLLKFGISRCHVCLSDLQWSGCGEHADNNSSNLSVELSQNTEWLGKTKKKTVTITLHPYFAALYVSLNEVYSAIKKGKTKTSGITLTCTYLPYAPLRQDMVHALLSSRPSFRIIYRVYTVYIQKYYIPIDGLMTIPQYGQFTPVLTPLRWTRCQVPHWPIGGQRINVPQFWPRHMRLWL